MNKRLRKKRGIYTKFKDKETWCLDVTIAQFILPRLRRFKEVNNGVPTSLFFDRDDKFHGNDEDWQKNASKEWDTILGEMIWAFEEIAEDKSPEKRENESWEDYRTRCWVWNKDIEHGLQLFAKHFRDLWW